MKMDDRDQIHWETMQAELRSALQHQRAAYQQMLETQRELELLMERAQHLLAREATGIPHQREDPRSGSS
jgi:hypothetical protein